MRSKKILALARITPAEVTECHARMSVKIYSVLIHYCYVGHNAYKI